MNEDALNMEVRKFLKKVGVGAQREIEQLVHEGIRTGTLSGAERLTVRMTLEMPDLGFKHQIDGMIKLG